MELEEATETPPSKEDVLLALLLNVASLWAIAVTVFSFALWAVVLAALMTALAAWRTVQFFRDPGEKARHGLSLADGVFWTLTGAVVMVVMLVAYPISPTPAEKVLGVLLGSLILLIGLRSIRSRQLDREAVSPFRKRTL